MDLRPPDDHDYEIMARTIFGEARGEPKADDIAIAHVICNRWRSGKWFGARSLAGVCLKRLQFSCWNHSDPTYKRMVNATAEELAPFVAVAKQAIEDLVDPTFGATHYYADTIPEPKWARGLVPTIKIGHHIFYAGVD